MPYQIAFWVTYAFWVILSLYWSWPPTGSASPSRRGIILTILLAVVIGFLGWKQYGPILQ